MDKKYHLLLIEDDPSLGQWIQDYLVKYHYQVTLLNSGAKAVEQIRDLRPDLVILDILLPEKNGFEICKEVRTFYQCPILMVTACTEESDEVLCFELGADDYLTKPVRPKAMLARIQTLLKRPLLNKEKEHLAFGELELDRASKTVKNRHVNINVTNHEFDVFWLLANKINHVVSRADLVSQLRGIDYDGFDRSIDIRVSRLRKKLQDADTGVQIKTIWGKGYTMTQG